MWKVRKFLEIEQINVKTKIFISININHKCRIIHCLHYLYVDIIFFYLQSVFIATNSLKCKKINFSVCETKNFKLNQLYGRGNGFQFSSFKVEHQNFGSNFRSSRSKI